MNKHGQPMIRRQAAPDWSCASILLYGTPGVGKTTAVTAATAPLVIDVEGGTKRHAGDVASVRSLAELEQIIAYLATESHPYESVVLDGLNSLYSLVFESITAGRTVKDRRLLHVAPSDQLGATLRRFTDLPLLKAVTAHSREELGDGKPPLKHIHVSLPPALRDRVVSLFDVVAYCWRNGDKRRMLAECHVSNRGTTWGKDRTGLLGTKVYELGWQPLATALGV